MSTEALNWSIKYDDISGFDYTRMLLFGNGLVNDILASIKLRDGEAGPAVPIKVRGFVKTRQFRQVVTEVSIMAHASSLVNDVFPTWITDLVEIIRHFGFVTYNDDWNPPTNWEVVDYIRLFVAVAPIRRYIFMAYPRLTQADLEPIQSDKGEVQSQNAFITETLKKALKSKDCMNLCLDDGAKGLDLKFEYDKRY